MDFRLLGPIEVRDGDRILRLGGQRPRTLIAVLALDVGRAVGPARLAELIWESDPPATASTQIQGYVSALRKQFATADPTRQVIVTVPAGYRLDVRPGELDLAVFEQRTAEAAQALAAGRVVDATTAYREALDLWRGPALGGAAGTLDPARDRLEERRLTAFEGRIEADLRLGRDDELLAELRDVVAAHPFREGPRGQLMLALYRAGRAAEALTVYREARTILADELGLDPGPELRRLEKAILVSDPALEPPPSAGLESTQRPLPAQLPPDTVDFTGRDEQVEQVGTALTEPPPGLSAVPVTVIAGRGGIGKTSLAVHVAHRMRHAFPDGQLYVNLHGTQERASDPSEILGRFLRALGVAPNQVPDSVEERVELFRSQLAGRRILIVLDNAADESQVRPLLPGETGCTVVVTSRGRLAGLEGAQHVDLEILEPAAAFSLLARVAGADRVVSDRDAGDEIVRLCGYLPLAVRIAGAKLAANPHWSPRYLADRLTDERHRLDELAIGDLEIRASVALSYAGLTVEEQQAFRRLGLLDAPDFAAWVIAALANVSQRRAGELADSLVRARLLDIVSADGGGSVRFRLHDLLRLYAKELAAQEESDEARDTALRRALDGWSNGAATAAAQVHTATFGLIGVSIDGWRAEAGVFSNALQDPLGWYDTEWASLLAAVEQARDKNWFDLVTVYSSQLAPYFVLRDRYDDWRRVSHLALLAADSLKDPLYEAAARLSLAELALLRSEFGEARTQFEQALERFQDVGNRLGSALSRSGLGAVETEFGRLDHAQLLLLDAVNDLRSVGDSQTIMTALLRQGALHRRAGRLDEAAQVHDIALKALGEQSSSIDEATALDGLGIVRLRQDRANDAYDLFARALTLSRTHRNRFGEARALRGLGEVQWKLGYPDDALEFLTSALRRWKEIDFPIELARTFALLGEVYDSLGESAAAQSAEEQATRLGWEVVKERDNDEVSNVEIVAAARAQVAELSLTALELYQSGRVLDAIPVQERVLSLAEVAYGQDSENVAVAQGNLAASLSAIGRFRDAEELERQSLEAAEHRAGSEHPEVITRLNNLGATLQRDGRAAEAVALQVRSLELAETTYGDDHPIVAAVLNNLAASRRELGQYSQAEELLWRALEIRGSIDPETPDLATLTSNLAASMFDTGRLAEALDLQKQALNASEATHGPNHPEVAHHLNNLGSTQYELGEFAQAAVVQRRAIEILETAYGAGNPLLSGLLSNLGSSVAALGDVNEALALQKRALAITQDCFGDDHPELVGLLNNLAVTHSRLGFSDRAVELQQESLSIAERVLGANHPTLIVLLTNLAVASKSLQGASAAIPIFRRAYALAVELYGLEHPVATSISDELQATILTANSSHQQVADVDDEVDNG